MSALYFAHSGLRYLVLLAGVVALLVLLAGIAAGRPYGRAARISVGSFSGLIYLQILLGLSLVAGGFWYPAVAVHLGFMLSAAAVSTIAGARARRVTEPRWAYVWGLGGVIATLLLIVLGIGAIGRGVLESQAAPGGGPVTAVPRR
ncbi:hypothetical protein BH20GEM2_BH20GEM2_13260 [soil metagenome]